MPKKSKVGEIASARTKEEFGDKLSSYTSLTSEEVEDLFPEQSDREELLELIKIVNSSADENIKKAKLVKNIGSVSSAVLKIGKKFASGM